MCNVSKQNLQRKLLALAVGSVKIDDQMIDIWSIKTVPINLLLEAQQFLLDDHGMVSQISTADQECRCPRCGRECDVLYVTGKWKCSACESVVDRRKQAVLELLEQLKNMDR
ncbi:hypothetical protein [Rhodopirellula baltica]|uniref:Uncharacterized protein n=1 Tax=Rhodopirellula baltica SWK14 TaxID=993516 RepID=L7CN17_RHOBT|nr:hypothetical protein [Rhodopirellula baltica]ELP35368.1 hypothetical protein RBSWK_00710 [Rhodopirellula baltica SWK14]